MTQKKLPPHIVLKESKEVIFYLENPLPSEITIPTWMKSFPDDYKGMIMTNACLFKRLKDQFTLEGSNIFLSNHPHQLNPIEM